MLMQQMAPAKKSGKTLPPAPLSKKAPKSVVEKFVEKTPRNFRVGGAIQPPRELNRFVRWPRYIRIQRQKRILLQRLKVPPAINQFSHTLSKNQAAQLIKMLDNYKPETKAQKKARLLREAERQSNKEFAVETKRPVMLKYGLNHVTDLVELKKAKLVVIAHDVEPIELVVWLPALCRKKDVPYCIIKGKSRLGKLVHQKNTCVVALDNIRNQDMKDFELMCQNFRAMYNDNVEMRRRWGGGLIGVKSTHQKERKEKEFQIEQAKKMNMKF